MREASSRFNEIELNKSIKPPTFEKQQQQQQKRRLNQMLKEKSKKLTFTNLMYL